MTQEHELMKRLNNLEEAMKMEYYKIIKYWAYKLKLKGYVYHLLPIDKEQVTYPDDIEEDDRYYIGVSVEGNNVIIIYDRPMTEEDILHELVHVKFPEYTEELVNKLTKQLLIDG